MYQQFFIPSKRQYLAVADHTVNERRRVTQQAYPVTFLVDKSEELLEQMMQSGDTSFRQQVAKVEYARHYSPLSDRDFLLHYFTESETHNDLMWRFHTARWTEQFTQNDLYESFIDAYFVCGLVCWWDGQSHLIRH